MRGYFQLGTYWRVPVSIHWAAPLAFVVLGRFQFRPGFWAAGLLLTLFHELGHAYVVRRFGAKVIGVELNLIGGLCRWQGDVSKYQRAVIAWGGVLAQGVVFLGTTVAMWLHGPVYNVIAADFIDTWTGWNVWMAALNLLPIAPLDGFHAWPAVPMIVRKLERRFGQSRPRPATTGHDRPVEDPTKDVVEREFRKAREIERLSADLAAGRLSPDLQRQLDAIMSPQGASLKKDPQEP